jgi:hypothetical protein
MDELVLAASGSTGGSSIKTETLNRMVIELVLKRVRFAQIEILKLKRPDLFEIYTLIDSMTRQRRLLDSRRPPPIDTGLSATKGGHNSTSHNTLLRKFSQIVTDLIISDHLFGGTGEVVGVPVCDFESVWKEEYNDTTDVVFSDLTQVPGIRISSGKDGIKKCTIAALATPSAAIASLFNVADSSIWNDSNLKLIELVSKFVESSSSNPGDSIVTTAGGGNISTTRPAQPEQLVNSRAIRQSSVVTANQLSELSSVIFKSIMSNGTETARECAKALKVLAEKDPKAIHQIVAKHLALLKNGGPGDKESAAKELVDGLVKRGRELSSAMIPISATSRDSLDQLKRLIGMTTTTRSNTLPVPHGGYSKQQLLQVQVQLSSFLDSPDELRNLRLSNRRK